MFRSFLVSATAAALLLGAMIVAPRSADATTMVRLGIDELTYVSDLVIEAEGISAEPQRSAGTDLIQTVATLRVLRVLKGDAPASGEVVVREWGGSLDGVQTVLPSAPVFSPGERVLVFLERHPKQPGAYRTVGLSQGKFTLILEPATGFDVLVKVHAPPGIERFDEAAVRLPVRRKYKADLVAQIEQDVAVGFVPRYQPIPGLSAEKDRAMLVGSIAWGHEVDPRFLKLHGLETK